MPARSIFAAPVSGSASAMRRDAGAREILVQADDGARLEVVARSDQPFAEGSAVGLTFSAADVYLFDAATGETLCRGIDAAESKSAARASAV